MRRIGEALGVNKILEGSVRTAGSRLRVTAQLVNVADGYQIWSARYDREMEDVFAIQDEIARAVVEALKMELAALPGASAQRKHSENLEAYHFYLKGRHQRFKQEFKAALRHYEEALERDPRYTLARAGIAEVMVLFGMYGLLRPRVAFTRAEAELEYALALDGESSEALAVECVIRMTFHRDWDGALRAGLRAVELNPDNVYARAWSGLVFSALGRHDEAIATARAAEAVPVFERSVEVTRGVSMYEAFLAWTLALTGRPEEARSLLDKPRERRRFSYVPGIVLAWIHGALREIQPALDEIDRSLAEHDHWLNFAPLPGNDPYRSESRFQEALTRMGLGGQPPRRP